MPHDEGLGGIEDSLCCILSQMVQVRHMVPIQADVIMPGEEMRAGNDVKSIVGTAAGSGQACSSELQTLAGVAGPSKPSAS